MTKLTSQLFGDLKESLVIKNLRAIEFAERLRGHVDNTQKGLLSGSKSEFYGTVTTNTFKLRTNKILKSEDFAIYGEFYEKDNGLIIHIEYTRGFVQKLAPIGLMILAIFSAISIINENGFSFGFLLFIIVILTVLFVFTLASKTSEFEKVSNIIRKIFQDKEIRELNEP